MKKPHKQQTSYDLSIPAHPASHASDSYSISIFHLQKSILLIHM